MQDVTARQGALFAIEALCGRLGRLFEPYMVLKIEALLGYSGILTSIFGRSVLHPQLSSKLSVRIVCRM